MQIILNFSHVCQEGVVEGSGIIGNGIGASIQLVVSQYFKKDYCFYQPFSLHPHFIKLQHPASLHQNFISRIRDRHIQVYYLKCEYDVVIVQVGESFTLK